MKTIINFSGLGFEVGQSKKGLSHSSNYARKYFCYIEDLGIEFIDHGDSENPNIDERVQVFTNRDLPIIEWDKYQKAYSKTREILNSPYPLLNWGGDHSIALATVGAFIAQNPDGYIIWIDAHADLNLPEHSTSGNLHGMPLSVLLDIDGIGSTHFPWLEKKLDPKKLIYIGLRDIDPFEVQTIESLQIKKYDYKDVEKQGMEAISKEILELTKGFPIHLSFDIDSVDPKLAPSTGVPVKSGLTLDELEIIGEEFCKKSNVCSVDIVEINPNLGTANQVDRTYQVAFNFLRSIFTNNYLGDSHDGRSTTIQREQGTRG